MPKLTLSQRVRLRVYNQVRLFMARAGMPLSENDRRLKALSNRHAGGRAFVLGMGPSLRTDDLERLRDEVTFACNKIFLAFEHTAWRPTYYGIMDELVAENNKTVIKKRIHAQEVFLTRRVAEILDWNNSNITVYGQMRGGLERHHAKSHRFSCSILRGIVGGGATVLFDLIQIAYAMGFQEVYLLGLDFSFQFDDSARTGERSRSGEVLVSRGEVNHFHKDYRKPGETWTVPRMEEQRKAFEFAFKAYERAGRVLRNASRETKLDVIPRVSLDDVLIKQSAAHIR